MTREEALVIAKKAHEGQKYHVKDYWTHVVAVADMAESMFGKHFTEDTYLVAMFHDVLEDTKVTANDLLSYGVSENVVNSVKIITKDHSKMEYTKYIQRIIDSDDLNAMMVKLADNKVNLNYSLTFNVVEKLAQKYIESIIMIETALLEKKML